MSKKKRFEKSIPIALGNMVCGVRPHAIALFINASIHVSIFVIYGAQMHQLWRFVLSFFFFIYPLFLVCSHPRTTLL